MTNTTAASKYIPRRPRISINWNPPFQNSLHKKRLKGGISIHADFGPPRYVLWCCGGICHEVLTFFQIGCGHTVCLSLTRKLHQFISHSQFCAGMQIKIPKEFSKTYQKINKKIFKNSSKIAKKLWLAIIGRNPFVSLFFLNGCMTLIDYSRILITVKLRFVTRLV